MALGLVLFTMSCQQKIKVTDGFVIQNVDLIDPVEGLIQDRTVIIEQNKIQGIYHANDFESHEENIVVDGTGKYLMPGLWDTHVHFAYVEELAPSMFDLFLGYGVTSVRDTGGDMAVVKKWKEKAEAQPKHAPRVKIAGPLLDGVPTVYDGKSPSWPGLGVGAGTVEDAVALVEQFHADGVDLIKAYEMLSPEQFKAVIKRSKELGLKVTGHVPLSLDVIEASNLGMTSMEHLRNIEFSCTADTEELKRQRRIMLENSEKEIGGKLRSRIHNTQRSSVLENIDPAATKEVLAILAKNHTWQIPTLSIMTGASERPFGRPGFQASFKYVPPALEERWTMTANQIIGNDPSELSVKYANWLFKTVGEMNEAGVPIMAGTDCPIFFLTPGLSLHEELALLVKSGLTNLEAISAATLAPAQYFDLEDELGTIAPNMIADLVLLDKNPLVDIKNTTSINAVVKDGRLIDKKMIKKMFFDLDNQ